MAKPKAPVPAKTSTELRSDSQKKRKAREAAEIIARRKAMARARYETDPKETQSSLARELKMSRQALNQIVKAEGWVKALDGGGLAQAANVAADRTLPEDVKDLLGPIPPHPTRPPRPDPEPDRLKAPEKVPDMTPAATALAVNARAEVLSRHRNELRVVRGIWQEVVQKRAQGESSELSKIALRTTQGLKLIQESERKAWGLDLPEAPPPGSPMQATVRVLVQREGMPPVHIQDEDDDEET